MAGNVKKLQQHDQGVLHKMIKGGGVGRGGGREDGGAGEGEGEEEGVGVRRREVARGAGGEGDGEEDREGDGGGVDMGEDHDAHADGGGVGERTEGDGEGGGVEGGAAVVHVVLRGAAGQRAPHALAHLEAVDRIQIAAIAVVVLVSIFGQELVLCVSNNLLVL